jgi:uncharacterized protein
MLRRMLLAAIAVTAAAFTQSATGMGLALVCGPALFAAFEPEEAIALLLVLGIAINLLVLFGDGGRPRVAWSEVAPLLAAAAPGVAVGALVLDALPKAALQVVVGVAVIGAVAARAALRRRSRAARPARAVWPARAGLGFACGALTTTTSVNGPPLVLWLQARGVAAAELRDSLNAAFLALSLMGTAALVGLVGASRSFGEAPALALLLPLLAAGYLAGRVAFRRLSATARFERAVAAVIVATGLASLLGGLAAL